MIADVAVAYIGLSRSAFRYHYRSRLDKTKGGVGEDLMGIYRGACGL